MLVDDRKEIRNVSVPPQHSPLRMQIKHRCVVGEVSVSSNLSISGRGEVGFSKNSELGNTHNPVSLEKVTKFMKKAKEHN